MRLRTAIFRETINFAGRYLETDFGIECLGRACPIMIHDVSASFPISTNLVFFCIKT